VTIDDYPNGHYSPLVFAVTAIREGYPCQR
jgi:hypothetical protein